MFKEFDTVEFALNEFQSDFSIESLWYDDLKRLIVIDEPKHQNKIRLVERGQEINEALARSITKDIADWHLEQYRQDIIDRATQNPISYDELFKFLNEDCRIFYDAAKMLDSLILNKPQNYGLQPMMHQVKSLCFIPVRNK